jgi:SAM-dependent methyltransferase
MSNSPATTANAPIMAFGVEQNSRRYRLRLARYKGLAETLAAFVREHTAAGRGKVELLDIAPGSGRSLRFLEAEGVADSVNWSGVDISERRLETIYKPERWKLKQADVTRGLDYPDTAFDVCLCEQLLEHLTDVKGVVAEIDRVLKPGGLAIFGVPTFPPGIAFLRHIAGILREKMTGTHRSHVQTFTCFSFCALLKTRPSFQIIEYRGFRWMSGGLLAPLEAYEWWYRFNRKLGRLAPWLCTEIQVVIRKRP